MPHRRLHADVVDPDGVTAALPEGLHLERVLLGVHHQQRLPVFGSDLFAGRQLQVASLRGGNDDVGHLLVVGGGEQLEQLVLGGTGGSGQFAGGVDGEGVALGLVAGLELPGVELGSGGHFQRRLRVLVLEAGEEGSLFGRVVEAFGVGAVGGRGGFGVGEGAERGDAAAAEVLAREEVHGQLVLVYLDEVEARLGLAEAEVAVPADCPLPLDLGELFARQSALSHCLDLLHPIIIIYWWGGVWWVSAFPTWGGSAAHRVGGVRNLAGRWRMSEVVVCGVGVGVVL